MATTIANALTPDRKEAGIRSLVGLFASLAVTTGLFWVMPYLIETAEFQLDERARLPEIDFVRVKRDESIRTPPKRPEEIPEPRNQPPRPDLGMDDPTVATIDIPLSELPTDAGPIDNGMSFGAMSEGDYLPIVKVSPIYPQRALARGAEGHCVVEYTVTRQGTIRDPVIVEALCTSTLFRKSSIDAARKFKYRPRVIDGEPVAVTGVRNKFTYRISD